MDEQRQHELTLHEFDALRAEIMGYLTELRKLEVYAVVAMAAVYSFLISMERGEEDVSFHVPILAWGLPIVFPILTLLRALAFDSQIKMIAAYITQIEERYGRVPLGWESRDKLKNKSREAVLARTNKAFWAFLTVFAAAVFLWKLVPLLCT
jgi:hypothetical protein